MEIKRYETTWYVREDTADMAIVDEVYREKVYDFKHIHTTDIKTVLDIGGHIGSFSVKAAQKFPNSTIITCEPVKANFDLLLKNVQDFKNIQAKHVAVYGGRYPNGVVSSHATNTGSNILDYTSKNNLVMDSVDINELINSLPTKTCDILKIDCEGGENSIFETLDFSKVKYLMCELYIYSNLIGMDETLELIKSKGFEMLHLSKCNASVYNFIAKNCEAK